MRGEEMGGGIFALRRPRPYSRHCEEIVAGYAAPTIVYAHIGINGSGEWADNDAARRVATPSKERENMFETTVFQKGEPCKWPTRVQSFLVGFSLLARK